MVACGEGNDLVEIRLSTGNGPTVVWGGGGNDTISGTYDNEEGRRVADTILEYKNRFHIANEDIAILYRTNAQSRIFEEYLRRFNLSYRIVGGQSFYQRKEVKDLIAYLRLVVNPNDEEALRRVINYPKRGIGDSSFDKIVAQARQDGTSVFTALTTAALPARTRASASGFVSLITGAQQRLTTANAYELAEAVAKGSTLLDTLRSDNSVEGLSRLENVNALLDGIQSFVQEDTVIDTETLPDKSLATYLQNIALLTDADEDTDGSKAKDAITLMSVHAAKGLEFRAVFVVGLEESLFPSWMSLDSVEGLDEERRLFYVAITRAEEILVLTYANTRYRFGKMVYNEPSRFLSEVPARVTEGQGQNRRSEQRGRPVAAVEDEGTPVSSRMPVVRRGPVNSPEQSEEPANFQPSPAEAIQPGVSVLHLKFGEGKVLALDGGADNRIATIHFKNLAQPQKRIMLRFAKLQVL
ncbi:MAG: ATP-binding domain-containing protein [Lewinella sp.]|nr:ATP-binding domain-containing protein [Lewinella sp.]